MVTTTATEPAGPIGPDSLLPSVLRQFPQTRTVFDRHGLRGCGGRLGPYESVSFFARAHSAPAWFTVSTGVRIDEVGLNATRTTSGWPVEMPPATPPA